MRLYSVLSSLLLLCSYLGQAAVVQTPAPVIRQIYTFGKNRFIENIAVRSNSDLLVTSMSVPTLFSIGPTVSSPNTTILYTFSNATGLAGITEVSPDVFAVVSADWDLANTRAILGTLVVWTINLSFKTPVVRRVANVVNTTLFNGFSSSPRCPNLVFAADSAIGAVWRVDLKTGAYGIAFSDPLFAPLSSVPGSNLGINGMKMQDEYLYFTNSAQGLFGRVEIDVFGNKVGAVEIIANRTTGINYDDFAIDGKGKTWIASHPSHVVAFAADGSKTVIANETLLLNPTSSAFGRGSAKEKKTLYVTNGGEFTADFDLINEGVVAVDTTRFRAGTFASYKTVIQVH